MSANFRESWDFASGLWTDPTPFELTQRLIEKEADGAEERGPPGRPLRGRGTVEDEDEGCDDVDGQADDCDEVGRHPQREQVHHPVPKQERQLIL